MSPGAMFIAGLALAIAFAIAGLCLIGFLDFPVEDDLAAPSKPEVRRVRAGPPTHALTQQEQDDVRAAARRAAYSEAFFGKKAINPHPSGHPLFVPWAIAFTETALEIVEQQAYGRDPSRTPT